MDFLQTLRAHTGGLLRIKSELFWYDGRGLDGAPGRVCLILDPADFDAVPGDGEAVDIRARVGPALLRGDGAAALLLIEGAPRWIWVSQEDVELIT